MTRIRIIVEGQTEESFINNVLAPSLWPREIYLEPFVLGVPGHQGGRVNYARVRKDIVLQLRQQRRTYCTTMFDLYGLQGDFPGMPLPPNLTGPAKAALIENGIAQDIATNFAELRPDLRLLPYLQVHEYEGLLFSAPESFAASLGQPNLARSLTAIREGFATPEEINDSPNTAPSKRIAQLYRSYKKVIEGTIAAQAVGIDTMRAQCPRFNSWVAQLEAATPLE